MALTITKVKKPVAPVVLEKVEEPVVASLSEKALGEYSLEELTDLYGDLQDKCAAIYTDPLFTRFDLAKAELNKRIAEDLEAADTAELTGQHWLIEVGACGKNSRKLKDGAIPVIAKMLGEETFSKLASITIANAEKYLTPDQVATVVESETGYGTSRKITAKFLG